MTERGHRRSVDGRSLGQVSALVGNVIQLAVRDRCGGRGGRRSRGRSRSRRSLSDERRRRTCSGCRSLTGDDGGAVGFQDRVNVVVVVRRLHAVLFLDDLAHGHLQPERATVKLGGVVDLEDADSVAERGKLRLADALGRFVAVLEVDVVADRLTDARTVKNLERAFDHLPVLTLGDFARGENDVVFAFGDSGPVGRGCDFGRVELECSHSSICRFVCGLVTGQVPHEMRS